MWPLSGHIVPCLCCGICQKCRSALEQCILVRCSFRYGLKQAFPDLCDLAVFQTEQIHNGCYAPTIVDLRLNADKVAFGNWCGSI